MKISTRDLGVLLGLLVASLGLVWAFLWWAAWLFTDWQLTLNFNSRGEQWVEGVFFHVVIVFGFWTALRFNNGGDR